MDNFPLFSFGKKEETEGKKAVLQALQALRDGKQTSTVQCKLQGLDREIADVVNEIIVQHQACEAEFDRVARETKDGKAPRVQLEPGMWLNMAWSVDSILRSHADQFHHYNKGIETIANGDFSKKITLDVQGAPLELQNSINAFGDNLNAFTSEIKRLTTNFGLGGRCEKITVPLGSGSWKDTTDSINSLHERLTKLFEETITQLNDALNLAHTPDISGFKMAINQVPDIKYSKLTTKFFANLSFELRTPLNAIVGLSEVLEESGLNIEQKDIVGNIKICGRMIIELVNDFLEFDRVMNGKLTVHLNPFNLRQACENTLCELSSKSRILTTLLDIDKRLPEILIGDSHLFMTMLRNLVTTHRRSCYDCELVVAVKELSRESDNLIVEVSIQGLSEDRTRKTSTDYDPDPIPLRIIQLLNGKWMAENTSANATVVTVTLPMKFDPDATRGDSSRECLLQREMLVVCASPMAQQVLARTISGLGMLPTVVGSFDGAIEHLQKPAEPGFIGVLVDGDDESLKKLAEEGTKYTTTPIFVMSWNLAVEWPWAKRLEKPVGPFRLLNALCGPKQVPQPYASGPSAPRIAAHIPAQYANTRILFAATNAVNRRVYAKLLEKLGCQNVVVVENGTAATKEFENAEYDVIFLDSVDDAFDTTKVIRSNNGAKIPIIGVTAHAKDREAFIDAGMDDHITKPVSMKALADVITRVLSAKTGESTADEGLEGEFVIVGNK